MMTAGQHSEINPDVVPYEAQFMLVGQSNKRFKLCSLGLANPPDTSDLAIRAEQIVNG